MSFTLGSRVPVHRSMAARSTDEEHRSATPLELLFDLTFVVAVSGLAARFAHAVLDGHALAAALPSLMVFFAVWWAWMNFTWFASAYDCDDVTYRLAVFVQMGGVLTLAAGVGQAFDGAYLTVTIGYLIMRAGLVTLWVRAALQNPSGRTTALRYASGIAILQLLWLGRLTLDTSWGTAVFLALVCLELLVPVLAERAGSTSWHPHHIAERYGLFTLILLGEGVLAATTAASEVVAHAGIELAVVSACSLLIIAAVWWLCFTMPAGAGLTARRRWSFVWGYGYFALFAAVAAIGAGLEVVVTFATSGEHSLSSRAAVAAIAVPLAAAVAAIDLLRVPLAHDLGNRYINRLAIPAALGASVLAAQPIGVVNSMCVVALIAVAAAVIDTVAASPKEAHP